MYNTLVSPEKSITISQALLDGFTEIVKITPETILAFNHDHTQAIVFTQLQNGHILPSNKISNVIVSKQKTGRVS
jgi:hypothetical protein